MYNVCGIVRSPSKDDIINIEIELHILKCCMRHCPHSKDDNIILQIKVHPLTYKISVRQVIHCSLARLLKLATMTKSTTINIFSNNSCWQFWFLLKVIQITNLCCRSVVHANTTHIQWVLHETFPLEKFGENFVYLITVLYCLLFILPDWMFILSCFVYKVQPSSEMNKHMAKQQD